MALKQADPSKTRDDVKRSTQSKSNNKMLKLFFNYMAH